MRHGVDYQVIDVRDDDFAGGNIPGAVNLPSGTITRDTIAELAQRYDNVPTLVFHCAQSQQRGPKAARVFSEEYQRVAGQVTGKKAPQVYVKL
ncbi:Cdc25 phosphatase Ibp1 [Sorochytrium milnesiophthora]